MAVAKLDLRDINWDLDGHLSSGGLVYTYQANSLTPLATYADATGGVANANPIVSDSSGQSHIWLTVGVAYKFVFATAADVTIYTENGVRIDDAAASAPSQAYDPDFYYQSGPPASSAELYRKAFEVDVDFPADFTGAQGSVRVNATSSFVATVKKNGSTVGTITISTGGAFTFATSGGATVSFADGDVMTVIGPVSADATIAGIAVSFAGTLA